MAITGDMIRDAERMRVALLMRGMMEWHFAMEPWNDPPYVQRGTLDDGRKFAIDWATGDMEYELPCESGQFIMDSAIYKRKAGGEG